MGSDLGWVIADMEKRRGYDAVALLRKLVKLESIGEAEIAELLEDAKEILGRDL